MHFNNINNTKINNKKEIEQFFCKIKFYFLLKMEPIELSPDIINEFSDLFYNYKSIKSHISSSDIRTEYSEKLSMGMPDMLFSSNILQLENKENNFKLIVLFNYLV